MVSQPRCESSPCQSNGCANGGSVCSTSEFQPQTVCAEGQVSHHWSLVTLSIPLPGDRGVQQLPAGGHARVLRPAQHLPAVRPAVLLQPAPAGVSSGAPEVSSQEVREMVSALSVYLDCSSQKCDSPRIQMGEAM